MRNLLAFLATAVIAFLGLGWYLGWYAVHPAFTTPGRQSYTIDIDAKKIKEDVQHGVRKSGDALEDWFEKSPVDEAVKEVEKKVQPPKVQVPDGGTVKMGGLPPFRIGGGQEESEQPKKPAAPWRFQ